jgi:uncharacterized protein (DUF885 family)
MLGPERLADTGRRALLAGFAAAAFVPARAFAGAATSLREVFDAAAVEPDAEKRLAFLRGYTPDPADRTIWTMVVRGIEREQALRRAFPLGRPDGASPYVVSQRHGAWLEFDAPKPCLAARLDEETKRIEAEAALGIAPPDFVIAAIVEGQRRAAGPSEELTAALGRQTAALESLRPTPGAGVWRLPRGAAYYALRLQCTTGSDLTPAQLDRRVEVETMVLLTRADRILKGLGLVHGSVGARLRALKRRPEHLYTNDDQGRDRAVAEMNAALERLRPHLTAWFGPPPAPEAAVRRMSAADEAAGRRGYRDPPYYYPDLAKVPERPDFTLTTVAYHETIPGHLLQLARHAAAAPHPMQLRYAAGYLEGWAIYAESLADRMGLLSPVQQLGFLQSILFRLARVSADLGLHFHRWERARAIAYLEETVGFELFFPFAAEVDRYAVEPAGFAGDALMAIELMRRARKLAPAAATRRFHDLVLNRGPLSVEALP